MRYSSCYDYWSFTYVYIYLSLCAYLYLNIYCYYYFGAAGRGLYLFNEWSLVVREGEHNTAIPASSLSSISSKTNSLFASTETSPSIIFSVRTWFRFTIFESHNKSTSLLTSRSNWALQSSNHTLSTRAKFLSALALATAREISVTAIATITTTARKIIDVCQRNYRYLRAAREDERRLINKNHEYHLQIMSTALDQTASSETSISIVQTREQSIAAIAALADVDPQDVLPVVLWLEGTVRGVERFTQVRVPGYVGVLRRTWRRITWPGDWAGALWTRVKMGLFFCVVLIGFWVTGGIAWLVRRVLVLALVLALGFFSWRCFMVTMVRDYEL